MRRWQREMDRQEQADPYVASDSMAPQRWERKTAEPPPSTIADDPGTQWLYTAVTFLLKDQRRLEDEVKELKRQVSDMAGRERI